MNVGSLFSGIGGIDLGLERAGMRVVWQCEADRWRRGLLAQRFPGVSCHEDVRDAQPTAVDLLCGGFPCQDVSVAGQRQGLRGERSGLFFEFARIAETLQPRFLLIENVPGLLSSNSGRDFGVVLETLVEIGYGVAWRILDSRFFGVPQRRRRVFILGVRANGDSRAAAERAGEVLAVGASCERHPAAGRKKTSQTATSSVAGTLGGRRGFTGTDIDRGGLSSLSGMGSGGPDDNDAQAGRLIVAAPLSHGSNPNSNAAGRRREDDENIIAFHATQDPIHHHHHHHALGKEGAAVLDGVRVRRLTPRECERLQGFPDNWTQLEGAADTPRYAALGDAVTVPVAEWIGHRIMEAV